MDIRMKSISDDFGLTLPCNTEIYWVAIEQLIQTHHPLPKGIFLDLLWPSHLTLKHGQIALHPFTKKLCLCEVWAR